MASVKWWRCSVKSPKITLSVGCLAFLCAYSVFDPYHSFIPFLLSAAAHEGGHLLALRLMKQPVLGVNGSLSGWEIQTPTLSYQQELLAALPGPGVNLLFILLFSDSWPLMALINLILLAYNLLPIYPLDGGRILRSILRLLLPLSVADWIEWICGGACFLLLFSGALYLSLVLHSGLWPVLLCAFLFYRVGETILPKRKITLDKRPFT